MNPKIESLASLIRGKREDQGRKFVLMLGAGASISSGVKSTDTIMEGLLAPYPDLTEGSVRDRFDRLLNRSDPAERDRLLRHFLDCRDLKPSDGYGHLADLIAQGYFDLVITLNFDQLLETSLLKVLKLSEFQWIVRGRDDGEVLAAMQIPQPRVKILKLHGGLSAGGTFHFTRKEMAEYPEPIKSLVGELTSRDILVCGYSFTDLCMVRAFSNHGGTVWWVNKTGPPEPVLGWWMNRPKPEPGQPRDWDIWNISGSNGCFDTFFADLHQALSAPAKTKECSKANPFRFLVSYDVRDKPWYFGRRKDTEKAVSMLEAPTLPKVLHLYGFAKAGKTSLVRAGVIASLDPARFWPVYLRCQPPLEKWLPQAIARLVPSVESPEDAKAVIRRLAGSTEKRVVVVLDQFERVLKPFQKSEVRRRQLIAYHNALCEWACPNLGFLCVATHDIDYLPALGKVKEKADPIEVERLRHLRVGAIIRVLARGAGISFEGQVIRAIIKRYDETADREQPFTLAHVQAVCNILADSTHVDMADYEDALRKYGDALDNALNACDIVTFVEDIPDETGRNLFRKLMKLVPAAATKREMAETLSTKFSELVTPPEFQASVEH